MPFFRNLDDVKISKDHSLKGVGYDCAIALVEAVDLFIPNLTNAHERKGTLIIDGQPLKKVAGHLDDNIGNFVYDTANLIARCNLPGGEYDGLFSSTNLAAMAIDALLEGRWQFSDFANRQLTSGIYHVGNDDQCQACLMVLEGTFGRFLVGLSDPLAIGTYWNKESKLIFLVIAQALKWLFPCDQRLASEAKWVERTSRLSSDVTQKISDWTHKLFEGPPEESMLFTCKNDSAPWLPFNA